VEPSYPAQPWHLRGHAWLSAWLVPVSELPSEPKPFSVAGRGLVFTAWVDYDERGELPYHELLMAVAVRSGPSIAVTITDIWVDSEASMHGARELWKIPKELADFDFSTPGRSPLRLTGLTAEATGSEGVLASAAFKIGAGLPFRLPARFSVRQRGARCPVRVAGFAHRARATWKPVQRLSLLDGREPLFSAHIRDFRMRFGS
jgi:hypothetical protein